MLKAGKHYCSLIHCDFALVCIFAFVDLKEMKTLVVFGYCSKIRYSRIPFFTGFLLVCLLHDDLDGRYCYFGRAVLYVIGEGELTA